MEIQICTFMEDHLDDFAKLSGMDRDKFHMYLKDKKENRGFGSEVELSACATLLQTPISTYFKQRWITFKPAFIEELEGGVKWDRTIYMTNTSHHYSPVLSIPVSPFVCYNLVRLKSGSFFRFVHPTLSALLSITLETPLRPVGS